ncbi:MAG: phage tail assembly chaperone [Sporomusa sp.]
MASVNIFLKENKKQKENTTYAATKSLLDENGEPALWTIRPISTKDNEQLRDECTTEIPVKGKRNMYRQKFDTKKYLAKLICASVVEPSLHDKTIQDSYGVMTPEELIVEMIDDPGEYADFAVFIQEFNGFTDSFEDEVEEVKND